MDDWPRHPNSDAIIASIGRDKPFRYNPDMGFVLVPSNQPRVEVKIVGYPGESDAGPFPVPDNIPIEGWPAWQRRDSGEQGAWHVAHMGEGVRHIAWGKKRIARSEPESFIADLHNVFSADRVKPFILVIVEVSCRATFGVECILKHQEIAAGMRDKLEGNRTDAKAAVLTRASASKCAPLTSLVFIDDTFQYSHHIFGIHRA